jgi:hypothetical protein
MNIRQLATAYVAGREGHCHNARTDGQSYVLHGSRISYKENGCILGTYGGWTTKTTHNHLQKIAQACGGEPPPPYGAYANTDPNAVFIIKDTGETHER